MDPVRVVIAFTFVSGIIGATESRIIAEIEDELAGSEEITSFPGVPDTVRIPPILSVHPQLTVLNSSVITNLKHPHPEAAAEPKGNVTGPDSDSHHVQTGMSSRTPPAILFRPQPAKNDPSNFSARVVDQKDPIVGMNDRKPVGLSKISKLSDVIRGIYWMLDGPGQFVTPRQPTKRRLIEAEKWIKDVKTHRRVVRVEFNGLHCGRNYLVSFDDGTLACVKQRRNFDQIQGEIFAYFLADLLGIRHHLPPTVLTKAVHNRLFESVMGIVHQSPSWDPTKPFIITKFLGNLKPIFLPKLLHPLLSSLVNASKKIHKNETEAEQITPTPDLPVLPLISPRSGLLDNHTKDELRELEQWSDLVVFDYLVGNLDRLANLAINLQWHSGMLTFPVHNVLQSTDDGHFIFMDNESGLFHGYRLLDEYDRYLQPLLRSFCIFNKSTVNALRKLHQNRDAGTLLMKMLNTDYPRLINRLPGIGPKTSHILQKRLRYVYNHIRFCEENHYLP